MPQPFWLTPITLGDVIVIMICKLKIDNRGRLTFPNSFLKANEIKKNSFVSVIPVSGRTDAMRLEFDWEDTDENDR